MRNEVLRLRTEADARLFQCNALAEEAEKREGNGEPRVECEDEDIQRLLRVAKWKRNMVGFPDPDARVEDTGETLSSKVYEGA